MSVWSLQQDECYLKSLQGALKRAPSESAVLYLIDVRDTPPKLVPKGARGTELPPAVELEDNPLGESFLTQRVVAGGFGGDAHGLCTPFRTGVLYLGRPSPYSREEKRRMRRWSRQVEGGIRNAAAYLRAVSEQTRDFDTGVFNREYLDQRIQEEYRRSERFGRELSLVSVQAESRFKWAASVLVDLALDTDLVGHLGNGHFGVLLIEASRERVEHFVTEVVNKEGLTVKEVVTYDRTAGN